ncbi:hypothetical protein DUNSADRAFT_6113 [Dunaliella salina]|uniref:Uncharacterized protein n=1 Tax=Dunaliella salina TaxID=3046 RepID=A0ABQ7H728_DUNSA|nr:hypothetical protein DUNSADRAFT_6113 [Dunaliella salina]|eukprot:KAF5842643.1 hypothetical protein DUNSADRAFT_6113 [Dunaliella salina]
MQNRALLLSLEKEKQRSAELQSLLKASPSAPKAPPEPQDPDAVEERARAFVEKAVEAAEAASRDANMWREKHQQQTNKMAQLEQKAFGMEIEYKKVVRALVREVGEEVPLSKVLDDGSDWKGRREQLIALRDQVKALKASQGLVSEGRHEAATKKNISKISGQRSAEMDRLAAEAAATRQELEATRTKLEAAIARRKVLEAEMASLKEKVAVVLDKSINDSKLISALRAEVAAAGERRNLKRQHNLQQHQHTLQQHQQPSSSSSSSPCSKIRIGHSY